MQVYREQLARVTVVGRGQLLLGFAASTLLLVASTWGLLYVMSFFGVIIIAPESATLYTTIMLAGSIIMTLVAVVICAIMLKYPSSMLLPLKLHQFFKRSTGEYFVCPDPDVQDWSVIVRRSLYGSLLVTGIALTVISFDLMVQDNYVRFGYYVMLASTLVLPLTLMQFYYGPWLIKDAGLFHLDPKDRSLSNVGDDLEDMLEFFAGVDIVLVWLELSINTYPWVPLFVIIVALGPLFSIVLDFTLVFMWVKAELTARTIGLLTEEYQWPEILESSGEIRSKVLALVDTEMLAPLEGPTDSDTTTGAMTHTPAPGDIDQ